MKTTHLSTLIIAITLLVSCTKETPPPIATVTTTNLSIAFNNTVNGKTIKITTANGVVVNMSKVTATDIDASNGVIHVIDTVLMPK